MHYTDTIISGWGNYPVSNSKLVVLPDHTKAKEILDFDHQRKIIARGLGRSYADQATNKNQLVAHTLKMNKFLSFDKDSGILHCQAGASLKEIIEIFAPMGWFPLINPGTKYVTIGGAIANDIHGKAHHKDGSFVNCVEEFEILLADGSLTKANRNYNQDLFWANFGGLGLLGIIMTAKIRLRKIENTYFKQAAIKLNHLEDLLDAFEDYDQQYDYSVAWVDSMAKGRSLGKGVLTLGNAAVTEELPPKLKKNHLKVSKDPKLFVPVFLPQFSLNGLSVKMLNSIINYSQANASEFTHYEKFFFPLDSIKDWNKGYGKRGFIQYQFVLPLENGRKNISDILKEIASSNCTPFLNVLKKFGPGTKYLSFPMEGYTFAIDFPVSRHLPDFILKLDDMVIDFGGRVYLGKDAMLKPTSFQKMYSDYEEWLEIKNRYDKKCVFSSDLSRRIGLTPPI